MDMDIDSFLASTLTHSPQPRTRYERKLATRYRRKARKELRWLAGYARRWQLSPTDWINVELLTMSWKLLIAPLPVLRGLRARLGKTVGGRRKRLWGWGDDLRGAWGLIGQVYAICAGEAPP